MAIFSQVTLTTSKVVSAITSPSLVPTTSTASDNLLLVVGVSGVIVVVLTAIVIVISVTLFLRWKRKRKETVDTSANIAYEPTRKEFTMTVNEAHDKDYVVRDHHYYSYAEQPTTACMILNSAYNAHDTKMAVLESSDKLSLKEDNVVHNVAYGVSGQAVELRENIAYAASGPGASNTSTYEYISTTGGTT